MFLSISNIGFSPGSSMTGENPEQFLLTGMHMRWLTETGSQGQQVFNQTRHARPRRELGSRQKAKPRRCKSASLHGDGGCGTRCPGGVFGRSLRASVIKLPNAVAEYVRFILCRFEQGTQGKRKNGLVSPISSTATTLQIRHDSLVLDRGSFLLRLECASTG